MKTHIEKSPLTSMDNNSSAKGVELKYSFLHTLSDNLSDVYPPYYPGTVQQYTEVCPHIRSDYFSRR